MAINADHGHMTKIPKFPYRIVRKLNGGLFSEVYLAEGRAGTCVLKVARVTPRQYVNATALNARGICFNTGSIDSWTFNPNNVIRKEASVLGRLNHPAFVKLLDSGSVYIDGHSSEYLVIEYIDGLTWRSALPDVPLSTVYELILALIAVHNDLPFHGDLKPENLFLDTDGRVRIIDPSSEVIEYDDYGLINKLLVTECYYTSFQASDMQTIGLMTIEVATGKHPLLLADEAKPPRSLGPSLQMTINSIIATGHHRMMRLFHHMPLPSKLNQRLPEGVERVALRCLVLMVKNGQLEYIAPYKDLNELAPAFRMLL